MSSATNLPPVSPQRRPAQSPMAPSDTSDTPGTSSSGAQSKPSSSLFSRFAAVMARAVGHPAAFIIALGSVIIWAISGPFFGFSDTWQLIINTSTTIITSLIVFLIQNTQNRDTAALQLKIDELIRAHEGAHNAVLDLEELEESDLVRIRDRYEELARRAREQHAGILDEACPAVDNAGRETEQEVERVGDAAR